MGCSSLVLFINSVVVRRRRVGNVLRNTGGISRRHYAGTRIGLCGMKTTEVFLECPTKRKRWGNSAGAVFWDVKLMED